MSISTGLMGSLPTYSDAGVWASLGLAITRLLQNFSITGETNGAAVFVLEHASHKSKPLLSSLVEAATMSGILLASSCIAVTGYFGDLQKHWRWLMWAGAIAGFAGYLFRQSLTENWGIPL